MTHGPWAVRESAAVLADYKAIALHLESWTGSRLIADRTVADIRRFVRTLGAMPARGAPRDDLRQGLRRIPFKRRTVIAYDLVERERIVRVLRVFYGGQDYSVLMD
jgi:plasmid stabilization system protein ParE